VQLRRISHFACFLLLFLCVHPLQTLSAQSGLTAQELYNAANSAYHNRAYETAAELYQEFVDSYGSSREAQEALRTVLPHLAFAQVRIQAYDRAAETIPQALALDDLPSAHREELTFWLGACQMQTEQLEDAYQTFSQFATDYPESGKRAEAGLLAATIQVLQQDWETAAKIARDIKDQLDPANRGRAVVLQLYSLVQANLLDDALTVLVDEYPRLDHMVQLAAFQTMALQLGSALLEQKRYRDALAALQRIWRRERLLERQEDRLDHLRQQQVALRRSAHPRAAYDLFQLNQLIAKIEREVKAFTALENFDSALRLRLATAFLGMQRYREAALVLEEMLVRLPPDPIIEEASETLIKAWFAIERWPKAVVAADQFAERFPQSEKLPLVTYMKGQAQQNDLLYVESIATLQQVVDTYPEHPITPRAHFLIGFGHLLQEQYEQALAIFESVPERYPKSSIVETSHYWEGMTHSLAKQFEEARRILQDYLQQYPEGQHASEAAFRRAYCAQSLQDFPLAIEEFEQYLEEYPAGVNRNEALLLLGEALMVEGRIDQGISTLRKIDPDATKFFEEGWFKVGKALRLLERHDDLMSHMLTFREEHPRSPRVAEAVYWMGWIHRQEGDVAAARQVYWDAIQQLGPDGTIRSVEELFPALAKLYPADERMKQYRILLQDLQSRAARLDEPILELRARWAQAQLFAHSQPQTSHELLADAAHLIEPDTTNPLILSDIADALFARGELLPAEEIYRDLIKWNPRAPQRADAHAQLGFIALALDNDALALEQFAEFQKRSLGSQLTGQVLLARAELLTRRGQLQEAQQALETVLEEQTTTGRTKAAALLAIGEIQMELKKPERAVPYYQRLYVLYGRWSDYVAQAYLRSGEAFEALDDREAAIRTYQELLSREELLDTPQAEKARHRLVQLGGSLAPEEPEPDSSTAPVAS